MSGYAFHRSENFTRSRSIRDLPVAREPGRRAGTGPLFLSGATVASLRSAFSMTRGGSGLFGTGRELSEAPERVLLENLLTAALASR